ncbi:MAG TPA: hypothetical protein VK395_13430 [Gemmataceae bacterium]|nr:hypothetical protein [Gemmataceae bacterium]
MDSLLSPSLVEAVAVDSVVRDNGEPAHDEFLLVAGSDDAMPIEFVNFVSREHSRRVAFLSTAQVCCRSQEQAEAHTLQGLSKASFLSPSGDIQRFSVVIFVGRRLSDDDRTILDAVAEIAGAKRLNRIILVGSSLVHFGDQQAIEAEAEALARLGGLAKRTVIFRPSILLSPNSRAGTRLRSFWWCYPLVPRRLTGCCVDAHELFAAVDHELKARGPRGNRVYTLLGPNRPWRSLLKQNQDASLWRRCLVGAAAVLGLLGVGQLFAFIIQACARRMPLLRRWSNDTLYPSSVRELLTLYNHYNHRHIKIVGYNNGVVHFGHKYPAKTIVSTARCNKVARLQGHVATFDCGVTLRQAIDTVSQAGKEFYVLPNYSYVSVGTSFFVPIHGSASDYSTLGETIEKIVLYSPDEDRIMIARRDDPVFAKYLYNLDAEVLLLRISFRVKAKCQYYLKRTKLQKATSAALIDAFCDARAANVEIRQPRADEPRVDVYRYYTAPPEMSGALAFPRDSLGRVWDYLEANRVLAVLFHFLMRRFGYHVELFFNAEEFGLFWETHASLPISKVQLRYIKQDGYPHSPFRNNDCISTDMFMLRRHKGAFEAYVKETFRAVQFNRGKHSM